MTRCSATVYWPLTSPSRSAAARWGLAGETTAKSTRAQSTAQVRLPSRPLPRALLGLSAKRPGEMPPPRVAGKPGGESQSVFRGPQATLSPASFLLRGRSLSLQLSSTASAPTERVTRRTTTLSTTASPPTVVRPAPPPGRPASLHALQPVVVFSSGAAPCLCLLAAGGAAGEVEAARHPWLSPPQTSTSACCSGWRSARRASA